MRNDLQALAQQLSLIAQTPGELTRERALSEIAQYLRVVTYDTQMGEVRERIIDPDKLKQFEDQLAKRELAKTLVDKKYMDVTEYGEGRYARTKYEMIVFVPKRHP